MRVQTVQRPKLFTRAPASAEADTIEGWLAYGAEVVENVCNDTWVLQDKSQHLSAIQTLPRECWLAYGAALNEGRGQFHPENDKEFGQWVEDNLLSQVATVDGLKPILRDDRAAAMWGAANPPEFDTARQASNARTVRGIYAKRQQ